jgi:hypothetical protein
MKTPHDLADKISGRRKLNDGYERETFALPMIEAREEAVKYYREFPKEIYMTSIEKWHTMPDGRIEFTMRRLKSGN